MLTLVTCVTVVCDQCDDNPELDDMTPHFGDEREALSWLAGLHWRVLAGGRLVCQSCAAANDCKTYGHQWPAWRDCLCDGRLGGHDTAPGAVCGHTFRRCERCDDHESRTPHGTTEQAVA
jgi:hypothetical protein